MRKSTLIVIGIIVLTFGSMLWLLGFYTDQVRFELETAGDWTRDLRERGELAPGSRVKVFRAPGGPDGAKTDPSAHGLRVEITLSDAALAKDPSASEIALRLAKSAFERYGPDREIGWVEVRLVRGGGAAKETLSFAKGDGGIPVPIGPSHAAPVGIPAPRRNLAPKEPSPPAKPAEASPGSPAGSASPK